MAALLEPRSRPRELGISIGTLQPGKLNSITDVKGVLVGHSTILASSGKRWVRTGVTAILPHAENVYEKKVIAAAYTINGFGKAMGLEQLRELGSLETPIVLTNTLSVPTAANAVIEWCLTRCPSSVSINPVVAECNDSRLNDITGLHVTKGHVREALESVVGDLVVEGTIGAGTGMVGFGFKGGVGTASRKLSAEFGSFSVGVLTLVNCGGIDDLVVLGVPVGRGISKRRSISSEKSGTGSIIIVLATDAPTTARQLARLVRRAFVGLARTGAISEHQSGDFVIAFSTAQRLSRDDNRLVRQIYCINESVMCNSLFQAVVESTEEAILNSLFTARTVPGPGGDRYPELPVDEVLTILRQHGRLS
jgi:D-aminopeptidase